MSRKDDAPHGATRGAGDGTWGTLSSHAHDSIVLQTGRDVKQAEIPATYAGWGAVLRLRDQSIRLGHDAIRRELEALALRKLEVR